jgi:hypothetical protein
MHSFDAVRDTRLLRWQRVREFAVPPTMIIVATARRAAGDWAGACAAARVDVDLDLRDTARNRGREFAARLRADLRHLAPDLLRWHLPRIAPDGLLRPGLTVGLARYGDVQLVARTPPAWAAAGQRISLALWDGPGNHPHPHPHPSRRFRLDLHRHLWDARRSDELSERAGEPGDEEHFPAAVPRGIGCAVHRWAAEAALLGEDDVAVRLGRGRWLTLGPITAGRPHRTVLPDAATWVLPDLELLRYGLIDPGRLHPLVARSLLGDHGPARPPTAPATGVRTVECRGARHRIGLVGGTLTPLDHDPDEIRREEMLTALGGTPLACLRAVDETHRDPAGLDEVRARLDHGDTAGALAVVEALLGPEAVLRSGSLRDELARAARRRVDHGLFRAGLSQPRKLYSPSRR